MNYLKISFECLLLFSCNLVIKTCYCNMLLDGTKNKLSNKNITYSASCFFGSNEHLVVINNKSNIPFERFQCFFNSSDFILLEVSKFEKSDNFTTQRKYKLDTSETGFKLSPAHKVIITNVDSSYLKSILYRFKHTLWWNTNAYYIIDNSEQIRSCLDVYYVLKTMWDFDILAAAYVCRNFNNDIDFYTFNPFINYASLIWTEVYTYEQEHVHPFTLFKLKSQLKGLTISCQDLFFDKTKNLGGYQVRIMGRDNYLTPYDLKEKSEHKLRGFPGIMYQIILTKLNATIRLTVPTQSFYSSIDNNGTPHGIYRYFFYGEFDLFIQLIMNRDLWQNSINTGFETGFCYITKEESLTFHERVQLLISMRFFLLFYAAVTSITFIFAYIAKRNYFKIFLDVVRSLTGVATIYKPYSTKGNIIFMSFIFVSILMNVYFQGELKSVLSVSDHRVMKSQEDLIEYNYTVYGHHSMRDHFSNTPLISYMMDKNNAEECISLAKEERRTACVLDCSQARFLVHGSELHVAKDDNFMKHYVFLVRDNFALHPKVASVYQQLHETGVTLYIYDLSYNFIRNPNIIFHPVTPDISLQQILPAFIFLGCGFVFSTFLCIVELCVKLCTVLYARLRKRINVK